MRHLIIGAGPAGVIAAEHLRETDPQAGILLIGDEPEPPYSRMALPYYLTGNIDERGTHLRKSADHFDRLGIELRTGTRVTAIEPADKHVRLEDGREEAYDRLLLATGSSPATPPIPGIEQEGVTPCWTLEQGRAIASGARPDSPVVLLGAGFIGSIVLEALARRGVELHVVEMGDRMVPRMMNETAGGLLKEWCEKKGVKVHVSTRATAIQSGRNGHRLAVELEGGEVLDADLVITATGVRPNTGLLEGSGVQVDQGILIDRNMQTSVEGIYAAGDVAQGRDFSTGEYSVQAIQPTAAEHGRLAALNMAGRNVPHQGTLNMNVLDTLGLISSSFGLWQGVEGGDHAELLNRPRYRYVNLQFEEDRLVGGTCLGLTEHIGVLHGLIQSRLPLGVWKERLMQDPTRLMEAYLACTQSLSACKVLH
ncbi:MAG: NAD(P)/FAD-dependent oxidoreductase [Gammaproteobacteria bacterium]|nr:MAG: NAD(P)/FAD-dependent oxidoreductase [Gammaproteobacteria bacterium]